MDWLSYQSFLQDRPPGNPVINEEQAIDRCIDELTSTIQEAIATSAPKHRLRADTWLPLPASIQDEIRLKKRLKSECKSRGIQLCKAGHPPPDVGNLSLKRVEERTLERCAGVLEQRGPVAVEDDKENVVNSDSLAPLASTMNTSFL
jgi:hypothetical protein